MIKINRRQVVPQKLINEGVTENLRNTTNYDSHTADYVNLTVAFKINNKIYGHATVKTVLRADQNNKCCFCEKDQREEDGTVEHFRPKLGFKQNRKDKLQKPGYYWLGYTWTNLLFCCTRCNGAKYKGNMFPLTPASTRARNHKDNLLLEDPYLIDPATIDPRLHIYFDDEVVKSHTIYGKKSIEILGLDRSDLNDMRKAHIQDIKSRIVTLKAYKYFTPQEVKEAKDFLINAKTPSAKFSAAAIDFIVKSGIQLN